MIGVLRDSDGDAEGGRVAASGDHLCGAWRGDHGAVTRTAVLLADVMLDLVRQLHRRTTLLERAQFRERELLGIRHAAQPCELRGQLQGLRDEALILAVEEETNLPQGVDIAFLRQVDHALRIGSSRAIRGKRKLRHRRGR